MRMLFASTIPVTMDFFMRGQLAWIAGRGHEVHVVSSPGPALESLAVREGAIAHPIPMEREISPVADARAMLGWVRVLKQVRPDVSVVSTPKAGLLGGLAAWLLQVPRRVYLMRGARFEGESGMRGVVLRAAERVACASAHEVIAVSPSLAELAVAAGVVPRSKVTTVGAGSSNGVDLDRFHPPTAAERARARTALALGDEEVAIAFVGRMHVDKGLEVLREALRVVGRRAAAPVVLLLAGPDEGGALSSSAEDRVEIRALGYLDDVPELLRGADVLALPTQREGFPNAVLEASASGLPTVTTDATGAVDSVVDSVTGFVVEKGDGSAFGDALVSLVNSPALRGSQGAAARHRVEAYFAPETVWQGMYRAYLGPLVDAESRTDVAPDGV